MRRSKETQPGYTEITFAVLSALTLQLLSWFGRFQHGRVPALLWVLAALCVAFSYSTAFKGRWLRKAAWWAPRHWLYWPAGVLSGVAGSCVVVISAAIAKKPPALHDPRLSGAVMTVTVAPVVEEHSKYNIQSKSKSNLMVKKSIRSEHPKLTACIATMLDPLLLREAVDYDSLPH